MNGNVSTGSRRSASRSLAVWLAAASVLGTFTSFLPVHAGGAAVWTQQFGTRENEGATGVAVGADGSVYVTGDTMGDLQGSSAGYSDVFVRKLAPDSTELWTQQFGNTAYDLADALAVGDDGSIYVTGNTSGDLESSSAGSNDAFVRKYTFDGTVAWAQQFGTTETENSNAVVVGRDGSVSVAGLTGGDLEGLNSGQNDAFVRTYGADGTMLWTHQFGTDADDSANAVAAGADGSIYVAGNSSGALVSTNSGSTDVFVRKYTSDGEVAWTQQFGTTALDFALGLAVSGDGIYVVGYTTGDLQGSTTGKNDAFVRKYASDGTMIWTQQFGTAESDEAWAVAGGDDGSIYITGDTAGDLGATNNGRVDVFVRRYAADGAVLWTQQFGSKDLDHASGTAVGAAGDFYVAGHTLGNLQGSNAGSSDAFVGRYNPATPQKTSTPPTSSKTSWLAWAIALTGLAIIIAGGSVITLRRRRRNV